MIGPGITIRGKISGEEDLDVEGRVEGSIRLTENLKVAEGAVVAAEVEARNVDVSGRIMGDITVTESIVIEADAVVVGDITTPRLHIADGARYKGKVTMDFDIPGIDTAAATGRNAPATGRRR